MLKMDLQLGKLPLSSAGFSLQDVHMPEGIMRRSQPGALSPCLLSWQGISEDCWEYV